VTTDLHAQLDAAVRARLDLARAAVDAPFDALSISWPRTTGKTALLAFLNANGPARIALDCERDLRVLERHKVCTQFNHFHATGGACHQCADLQPCPDVSDLAVAYGLLDPTAGE